MTKLQKAQKVAGILGVDVPVARMFARAVRAGDVEKVVNLATNFCCRGKNKKEGK